MVSWIFFTRGRSVDFALLCGLLPLDLGERGGLGVFLIGKGSGFDRAVPVVPELGSDSDGGPQAGDASS